MLKKTKFLIGLSASLLTLVACGGQTNNFQPMDEEEANAIIEELKVVDADSGVYGNIYLPEEVNGATITWKSSKPKIINPNYDGEMAPGSINRPSKDTVVKLTATYEKDGFGGVFSQEVKVKGLSYELQDEDYEGYLFGHFISEDGKEEGGKKIAQGEQMYFALADVDQGLHFKDLSTKNNPILSSTVGECGVRDPFMMRSPEGDRFFIVATDLSVYTRGGWGQNQNDKFSRTGSHSLVFWESYDLVNWSESRLLPVAPANAGMAWAPEMIYHEETGQYVVFFASCLVNEDRSQKVEKDAIYYVTTRDFIHISEPKLLIPNQDNGNRIVIDASITNIDGTYYSAVKDGDNNVDGGGILIQKTTDLFDPNAWEKVCWLADTGLKMPDGKTAPSNKNLEGPEWFIYNQADREDPDIPEYGLMGDQYMNSGAGYLPFATTDIEDWQPGNTSWKVLKSGADGDYSWDTLTKRHGTILRITAEECEAIKEAYLNK